MISWLTWRVFGRLARRMFNNVHVQPCIPVSAYPYPKHTADYLYSCIRVTASLFRIFTHTRTQVLPNMDKSISLDRTDQVFHKETRSRPPPPGDWLLPHTTAIVVLSDREQGHRCRDDCSVPGRFHTWRGDWVHRASLNCLQGTSTVTPFPVIGEERDQL